MVHYLIPQLSTFLQDVSFLSNKMILRVKESINKGLAFILKQQENDGSWFGRWGTNYIYGTWSVVSALNLLDFPEKKKFLISLKISSTTCKGLMVVGEKMENLIIKALKVIQRTVHPLKLLGQLWALIAAGEIDCKEVEKGIKYLFKNKLNWTEESYTAVGFPKVFYLKYHGYAEYFPLLAISKIKNQLKKNSIFPNYGT